MTLDARLARADRRDALLDAALDLLVAGDADAVSMEAVAERARVSRPLVYKHFANRDDLLTALYQREALLLHEEIAAGVNAATTLDETFRALIRGALRAEAARGAAFALMRRAGLRSREARDEQRDRDRTTFRWFVRRATRQLGLGEREARAAVGILLGAIEATLAQWRARPTAEHAADLEDAYVALAIGGLRHLGGQEPVEITSL
jgi:AcrR family transcriptional regulator